MMEKSNMEYATTLYDGYQGQRKNKFYDAVLYYLPPLSPFDAILFPFLYIIKKPKINEFFIKLAYAIFWVIFFVLFNILALVIFIPLAWLKVLKSIIINDYYIKNQIPFRINLPIRFRH